MKSILRACWPVQKLAGRPPARRSAFSICFRSGFARTRLAKDERTENADRLSHPAVALDLASSRPRSASSGEAPPRRRSWRAELAGKTLTLTTEQAGRVFRHSGTLHTCLAPL